MGVGNLDKRVMLIVDTATKVHEVDFGVVVLFYDYDPKLNFQRIIDHRMIPDYVTSNSL